MTQVIDLMTYADVLDHLVDFQRANPSQAHTRGAKRAIHLAYDNFRNDHQWTYYYRPGRLCLNGKYAEGSIVYDKTGGGIERQVTLTGGIWPDWAEDGRLIINEIIYDVAARVSDTVLQLDVDFTPHTDITTPSSYVLMRDEYPLPADLSNIDRMIAPRNYRYIEHIHPRYWLEPHRRNVSSSDTPHWVTVIGSTDYMGSLAAAFYPYPDVDQVVDFVYQRRPRPLKVERVSGTLSAGLGVDYANWMDGDMFHSDYIGSLIRVTGSDGTELPTGREGENPYSEERTILNVNTAGDQLTVDQQWLKQHNNAKFVISDPLDVEPGAMRGIFLRRCEMELAILTKLSDRAEVIGNYYNFLERHKAADKRHREPRDVYTERMYYPRRLANMPMGPDDE